MNDIKLQVLRCLDKAPKIGIEACVELLQKPLAEFGGDLDTVRAQMLGRFMQAGNEPDKLQAAQRANIRTNNRLILMEYLDSGDSPTQWDLLLAMPANADNTWNNSGRPDNVAWALDDIIEAYQQAMSKD